MIVHRVEQGTPEWFALHIGRPSASGFDRILTPKTRKPSASAGRYAIELCAAWLGETLDGASSRFMERGLQLEAEARSWYEFTQDVQVEQVGFITDDADRYGCSPDGLIGEDGVVEFKCLSPVEHVAALLGEADEYALQIAGQLWITGRSWCDRVYYHPTIRPVVQRVGRDEELIAILCGAVGDFCDRLDGMKAKLLALGCNPATPAATIDRATLDAEAAEFDALVAAGVPSSSNATLLGEVQRQREARTAPAGK